MKKSDVVKQCARARWSWLSGLVLIGACAGPSQEIQLPGAPTSVAKPAGAEPLAEPAGANTAGQAPSFSTQSASYVATPFDKLPGWKTDNLIESWPAFLGSCSVLAGRGGEWKRVCDHASAVGLTSNDSVRAFFENEFAPYQVRDDGSRADGVVTGYFEPEIKGSRQYRAPYVYPVYGVPEDMLVLDARKVSKAMASSTVAAKVEGREVVIQTGLSTRTLNAPDLYLLDLAGMALNSPDRKVRLRIEGKRLLPYYTREEIETRGAPNAKVLAFVQDAMELYEMQVQGTGTIKLTDGGTVHLAYADQNGHPFRPTVAQSASKKPAVKMRGGMVELDVDAQDDDEDDPTPTRTRGFKLVAPPPGGRVAVPGRRADGRVTGSGIKDPSYVFFRETPPTGAGPMGAMNVPLSPGRSIAVDPRSTPLGFPVFVSTRDPGDGKPMRRLTIAQDTGGAIRGAVRADYFFGSGPKAASQARRMKASGQLWVLLPRGLKVAAGGALAKTRGAGGVRELPQCLVETEDQCVDEQ